MNTRVKTFKPKTTIKWPLTETAKKKKLGEALDEINKAAPALQAAGAIASIPVAHKDRFTKQIRDELAQGKLEEGSPEAVEQADIYMAENAAWDEVQDISVECARLLQAASLFAPALRNAELMALVTQPRLLARNVESLTRDTVKMIKELEMIRKTHKDRKGAARTADDLMQSCSVFTDYVNFMDRHQASVMPTTIWVSEIIQQANVRLGETNPEAAQALAINMAGLMNSIVKTDELTGGVSDAAPIVQEAVA